MAQALANPSREDFAAMLEESFTQGNLHEGSVIKGKVVGIEKDVAIIDVGLKTEGRVQLRPGRHRHCRGRPSGPKAGLTALRLWRNARSAASSVGPGQANHRSDRTA